jgi:site-specific recombinase XerD
MVKHFALTTAAVTEMFLLSCDADGLRPPSILYYVNRFKPFCEVFGTIELDDITTEDMRLYFANLRSRATRWEDHPYIPPQEGQLAPDTVHGHFRALRRFFNWCVEENLIEESPVKAIKLKRPRNRIPKGISIEAFEAVLAMTEGAGVWKRRDRAIVFFLGDTGCRAGGLANLNVADINLDERFALLTEKGGKQRFTPFSDVTGAALLSYLELRPLIAPPDQYALFISQRSKARFSPWGLHQLVDRLGKRAGIKENVSLHRWRHAFARWYLINGGDLSTLSDLLGHSSVEVTREYYAVFNREELQRKHQQHSMVARRQKGKQ